MRPEIELNFCARAAAIDDLEVRASDEPLRQRLEEIDARLFERLRSDIAHGAALRPLLDLYVPAHERRPLHAVGYDCLDLFVNALLAWRPLPNETPLSDAEMIRYQQTPSRIVLEMIDRHWITAAAHFIDIGSGLGQVAMLVNLLTSAPAIGIEVDSSLCDYATTSARELALPNVSFHHADARDANLAEGNVFFLYTPFVGSILATVMERLRAESAKRPIRVLTYGPITAGVSSASWLRRVAQEGELALFAPTACDAHKIPVD